MAKVIDRALDRIGPVFIAIAVVLIDMCTFAYYLVIFPYCHHWTDSTFLGKLYIALTFLFTLYMVYCIHFHYYMAIKTPPGSMSELYSSNKDDRQPSTSHSASSLEVDTGL